MYFLVANAIVDRDDLNIYEKMACIVLARYANQQAFENLLSLEAIALKMGTTVTHTKEALDSLKKKGLLATEKSQTDPDYRGQNTPEPTSMVMKQAAPLAPFAFENFEQEEKTPPEGPDSPAASTVELMEIFEELVSKRQVLILYEMAGRNKNKLMTAYAHIKGMTDHDVLDALSDYLQQPAAQIPSRADKPSKAEQAPKQEQPPKQEQAPKQEQPVTDMEVDALFKALEMPETIVPADVAANRTQVNLSRIHALYKTQKNQK